ncbi:hypothetical protein ATER59S_05057 [Aquamicrobium terrae]
MNLSARVRKLERANAIHEPGCLSICAETEQEYEARCFDLIMSARYSAGRRLVISATVGGVERSEDFVLLSHEEALEHLG